MGGQTSNADCGSPTANPAVGKIIHRLYGWKGSVGGWRRPPWLWWVRCKISLDFVCVLKCEILAGNISSQKTTVSALPFQVSYARGLDTRQVVASCDHTVHVPAKSQACIEKREEKAKAKKGRIWVLVDRDWYRNW